MATPTIISASSTTCSSATSITVNAPNSISAGNVLIAAICTTSSSNLSSVYPDGWILLNKPANGQASFWKIATSNEPSDYTWSWTTSSVGCGIIIQASGNHITPIDVTDANANSSSSNITAPSITTGFPTDLLINIYASNADTSITVPAGQNNIGGTTGNSRAIICGYQSWVNTKAKGTITSSGTNVSNDDTVTIGGQIYKFKTTLTPSYGEVLIGATSDDSLTNLSRAINNSGGTNGVDYSVIDKSAWVTCSAVESSVLTLTSIADGTIGNSTTISKSASTLTLSGATLSGAINGNSATGTRIATGGTAINYGFSISIKEPIVANKCPTFSSTDFYHTNVPNSGIIGIGGGNRLLDGGSTRGYGFYKIEGYTIQMTTEVPLSRYAILYDMNGYPLYGKKTKVEENGFFSFTNLAPGNYIVIGLDQNGVQNGVIATKIAAVPM